MTSQNRLLPVLFSLAPVMSPGHGDKERKELTVTFANDRLTTVTGDFPLPAAFNTPL